MSVSKHKHKIPHTTKAARIRGRLRVSVRSLVIASQDQGANPDARFLFRSEYSKKIDKLKRTSFKVLPPIRFIDLIPKYRTVGDLCIICKMGQTDPEDIYGERMREMFLPLNSFKRFSKAEYEEKLGIFSLNLETFSNDFYPAKFIIERLESLQDRDAYEVSKLIKIYNKSVKQRYKMRENSRKQIKEKLILESLIGSLKQLKEEADEGDQTTTNELECDEKKKIDSSNGQITNITLSKFPDSYFNVRRKHTSYSPVASSCSSGNSTPIKNSLISLNPLIAYNFFQAEYTRYEEYQKVNEKITEKNKKMPIIITVTEEPEKKSKFIYETSKVAFNVAFLKLINPQHEEMNINLSVLNAGIPPILYGEGSYFHSMKCLLQGMLSHHFKVLNETLMPLEIRTLDGISLRATVEPEINRYEGLNHAESTTFLKLNIDKDDLALLKKSRKENTSKGFQNRITEFFQNAVQDNMLKTTEFLNKCYPGTIPQNSIERNSTKVCGYKLISTE
jgi:hypothetical protein